MRTVLVLSVVLVGCGSRSIGVGGEDAARDFRSDQLVVDAAATAELARSDTTEGPFCSGAPKAVVDGETLSISRVVGEVVAMGCCDGSAVRFDGQDAEGRAVSLWVGVVHQAGGPAGVPTTIDLDQLDERWAVEVRYEQKTLSSNNEDQFAGMAKLDGKSFYDGLKITLCLEAKQGPWPYDSSLETVRLFAPEVEIPPAR